MSRGGALAADLTKPAKIVTMPVFHGTLPAVADSGRPWSLAQRSMSEAGDPTDRLSAEVIRLPDRERTGISSAQGSIVDELYRKHARYLAGLVFRMLGNHAEVDDVLQEVFCVAMERLDELTRVDELRSWLAVVASRVAGKRLRRRRLLRALGFQDGPADYEDVASPSAPFEDRVELKRLYRALDRLPVRQRLAWTARYLENEPVEEVAKRCGCSVSTAKRDVATAHAVLARELGYE